MNDQEKEIRNTLSAILDQVDELSQEERDEFWGTLDQAIDPAWIPIIKELDFERKCIAGIAEAFKDIPTSTGDPITKIAFVSEDDPDGNYEIDLETKKYS